VAVVQQAIEQAKTLAQEGELKAAIALLSKLIQRDASNVEAWIALSEVVEEPDRIEFCLNKVLDLDPVNPIALERLSNLKGGSLSLGRLSSEEYELSPPLDPPSTTPSTQTESDDIEGPERPVPNESAQVRMDAFAASPGQPEAVPATKDPGWGLQADRVDPVAPPAVPPPPELPRQSQVVAAQKPARRSFGRTDVILVGLTLFAGLVLCSLVGAAVIRNVSLSAAQPAEDPDAVVQVVFDNIVAANREDIRTYMATIHPESPGYDMTLTTIQAAFTQYDLSYEIFIPEMLEQGRSEAVISFVLTTRKVQGPAFRDNVVTGEMTLRKHEGAWKIYHQSVDNVQYLN